MTTSSSTTTQPQAGETGALARTAATAPALYVLHSPDAAAVGRSVVLDGELLVGRSGETGAALALDDARLSRRHAVVRLRRDRLGAEIEDLGSRNGTFVEAARAPHGRATWGEVLRLGDTLLELCDEPPAQEARFRDGLAWRSAGFDGTVRKLDEAAKHGVTVLLCGETGTGKELLARALHRQSGRRGELVAVNCAAIPRELMEATLFGHTRGAFTGAVDDAPGQLDRARAGSLFLDEIGELHPSLQAKLLRVLENGEYLPVGGTQVLQADALIVSATNADLAAGMRSGTFRADLYARIATVVVRVPPLRQRRSDIPLLISRFLTELSPERAFSFTANALERLLVHGWPMNVRELRNVAQRLSLSVAGDVVHSSDVRAALSDVDAPRRAAPAPSQARDQSHARAAMPTREELTALLAAHHGAVAPLAAHYGKHRKQVHRWLERYGLDPEEFK